MAALLALIFISGGVTTYGAVNWFHKSCTMVPFNIHVACCLILMFILLTLSYIRLNRTLKAKLHKEYVKHEK